jgi:hypothetical protein
MNRHALLLKLSLKFREWKIDVVNSDSPREQGIVNRKLGIGSRESLHLIKVIELISRDSQQSVRRKRAVDGAKKFRGHHSPPLMPTFWPRVGEQKMKNLHRSFGQQITDGVGSFHPNHSDVVDPRCFATGAANPTEQALNAEEILLRHPLGQSTEERPISAAKIDVQRRNAPKDFRQIEGRDVRLRDQFDHGEEWQPSRGDSTLHGQSRRILASLKFTFAFSEFRR